MLTVLVELIITENLFDKPQIWIGLRKMHSGSNDSCLVEGSSHCDHTLVWENLGNDYGFDTSLTMTIASHLEAKQSVASDFFIIDSNDWKITDKPDSWRYHVMCQDCNNSESMYFYQVSCWWVIISLIFNHYLIPLSFFEDPRDGSWSTWQLDGACSVSCDTGTVSRIRMCTNPSPTGRGRACVGLEKDIQECEDVKCPGNVCLDFAAPISFHMSLTGW